ncbi:sensor histidine kinase [Sediminibacterium goheungense]|uniref:histidine kinase n=1 Tax=Sediminibacterium goheungense TaxID=1086393 RepID=A0A4R6IWE7_9BACT|nr:ATP-binding protein [Sediminibacterium goheungense]TDO27020.1 histidine kinase/DNA gyrase B/HSP90-like ATPase [Sediminibacterium goheungense]
MRELQKIYSDLNGNALLKSTIDVLTGHEFMIPINGILDFSEFLQRDNISLSDEDKKKIVKDINVGAAQLKGIAHRLHTWHDLLLGSSIYEHEFFELSSECIKMLVFEESKKNLIPDALVVVSFDRTEYFVKGNKKKFIAAVSELIQNACKFSEINTAVSISIKQKGKKVILSISNFSVAATVYELQRYRAFSRLHKRKTSQQGIGLGLAIARLGITQCNGQLKISRGVEMNKIIMDISLYKNDLVNKKMIANEK